MAEVLTLRRVVALAVLLALSTASLAGAYQPDDPRYEDDDQYAPKQVQLAGAWNATLGDDLVTVAVLDSGIDEDHPDLGGAVADEHDYANDDDRAEPCDEHGTHVAGIVAARTDNDEGVAGTAQVKLLDYKVLGGLNCAGDDQDIADAIEDATAAGADVISMSFGHVAGLENNQAVEDAIEEAADQDIVLVAAAGNEGPCPATDCVIYPAAYPEVIAVTATNSDEERWVSSAQGAEAELAAPGKDVLSTCTDDPHPYELPDYCELSGTSMAAPRVAGVAALLRSIDNDISEDRLRSILQRTAQDLGDDGRDRSYGHGEVDAEAAVDAIWDGNTLPVAAATFACDGLTCTFDGTGSRDRDGSVASYRWTFDDGSSATGAEVTHRFDAPGTYQVRLTVVDDDGASDATVRRVEVEELVVDESFDDGVADGFATTGQWRVSSACSDPPSGPNYLGYHKAESCAFAEDGGTAGSAEFTADLTGEAFDGAKLRFQHRWDVQPPTIYPSEIVPPDEMAVQARTDGGDWTTLESWSSEDGESQDWSSVTIDLDGYVGSVTDLRFDFESQRDDDDGDGWHVDDVEVAAS